MQVEVPNEFLTSLEEAKREVGTVDVICTGLLNCLITHSELPSKPADAFRKNDGVTPYGVHPCLGGLMILEDGKCIPDLNQRLWLSSVFFMHDILEDTTMTMADIDENCEPEAAGIFSYVDKYLTLDEGEGSAEEFEKLSKATDVPPEVWYLKTIDKLCNLSNDQYFIDKGTLDAYTTYLSYYSAKAIEAGFGDSFWVQAARARVGGHFTDK